jgi:tRNA U38,U39,U40 pseudouridine synthase TruA
VFVQGFQVRNMDSSLVLVYENDSQVRSIEKILRRINTTYARKKGIYVENIIQTKEIACKTLL